GLAAERTRTKEPPQATGSAGKTTPAPQPGPAASSVEPSTLERPRTRHPPTPNPTPRRSPSTGQSPTSTSGDATLRGPGADAGPAPPPVGWGRWGAHQSARRASRSWAPAALRFDRGTQRFLHQRLSLVFGEPGGGVRLELSSDQVLRCRPPGLGGCSRRVQRSDREHQHPHDRQRELPRAREPHVGESDRAEDQRQQPQPIPPRHGSIPPDRISPRRPATPSTSSRGSASVSPKTSVNASRSRSGFNAATARTANSASAASQNVAIGGSPSGHGRRSGIGPRCRYTCNGTLPPCRHTAVTRAADAAHHPPAHGRRASRPAPHATPTPHRDAAP